MFSIQQNFAKATEPCLKERFYATVENPTVGEVIAYCRKQLSEGNKKEYDRWKRKLPAFIFMAEVMPNTGPDAKGNALPEARWRKQSACRLNGLVMVDFDHVKNPAQVFNDWIKEHAHWLDETTCRNAIMLAHVTPSGEGLRLVCRADPEVGNLYDNAQRVATAMGLTLDDQCKDSSRLSFAVGKDDILYINDKIFDYDDEKYDEQYGNFYRSGGAAAASASGVCSHTPAAAGGSRAGLVGEPDGGTAEKPAGGDVGADLTYDGVSLERIVQAYLAKNTNYAPGHRRDHCNRMALVLRHTVENSAERLKQVVRMAPYVKAWEEAEHNGQEIDKLCEEACQVRYTPTLSKQLRQVLTAAGWRDSDATREEVTDASEMAALVSQGQRLRSLLAAPYDVVTEGLSDANVPAAVFSSATMFCTLMTRTQYEHYDGKMHRMNPQTIVIGQPGTGKGMIDWLNQKIMSVLRAQDAMARKALQTYKKKRKERTTSSKEQKQEALVEPDGMIRNLLTNTSNNQFYKRLLNAKEEVDGELWWLHVYMFDSELASANKANGGADWIGKRDLELKAFHNELAGSDYANEDSVNDFIPVHWCSVTTGTKIALSKKYTLANINDGLCTRQAIVPMDSSRYKMIARGDATVNHERELALRQWGFWFDRLKGTMPLGRLVDHVYSLCELSAAEAELSDDKVLDTLRRRAVFYATWFTVPRIAARLRNQQDGSPVDLAQMEVTDDDLRFATTIYDMIVYWQDYYFGQMLQDSWENAGRTFQPRVRKSANSQLYSKLDKKFRVDDVVKVLNVSRAAANCHIYRWRASGYIERLDRGVYKKMIDDIE
jgi:hypothetical protein